MLGRARKCSAPSAKLERVRKDLASVLKKNSYEIRNKVLKSV